MRHATRTLFCAATLAAAATASVAEPMTYTLPDETAEFRPGPNVEVAQNNCSACHSADYIETQPPQMGEKFWDGEVHKMIKTYGAPISEEDATTIIDYLAKTY